MSAQDETARSFRDTFENGISIPERKSQNSSEVAGYKESSAYPSGFNAANFPLDGTEVRMTGNNMAFFFASPEKKHLGSDRGHQAR